MIEGADWSKWQGNPDCAKFKERGGKFLGIKVSQGTNIQDARAAVNNANARAQGILTFPYHFVSTEAPLGQYDWFMKCIGDMQFDLTPALDYEYYNQITKDPYTAMRAGDFRFPYGATEVGLDLFAREYGLVIPLAGTLYYIANKLKGWRGHAVPAIYTSPSVANAKLFNNTTYNWKQFLLWHAQWTSGTPTVPAAWKGQPIYIWQDKVIKGAGDWGVSGDMDHDVWQDALPFPGDTPAPESMQWRGLIGGEWWCGEIKKERC